MLVPLKWLKEFVDYPVTAGELARALTMSGLEVDGIIERHAGLAQVVVAKVTGVEPHPGADKLRLAQVDAGPAGQYKVVCGAPNLREGMISALALPGAELAEGFVVKKAKIRGVQSIGMLCSEREMAISDDHSGIVDLHTDSPLGAPIAEALNLETQVLEISITPNRGDALSVLGVARDVAAIYGLELTEPTISMEEHQPPITDDVEITVSYPEGCPRYAARLVREVSIGPSPIWMADRLSACDVRPINSVVDVTNYVLMERGQPLHAFDYTELAGGRIDVREAMEGERFVTLDGQERVLEAGMSLICDGERPVGLAGVMGGLNSEIKDDTATVLIESANFDPLITRRTGKTLGLSTEAGYRFERGVDRDGCAIAADRAAQLTAQLAGGQVAAGIIDVHPIPYVAPSIPLSVKKTAALIGLELSRDEVAAPLKRLGLKVEPGPDPDTLVVEPPASRPDLERPADLAEEVARMKGYDNIPPVLPQTSLAALARAWDQKVREKARDLMAAQGFDEAINYSFDHPQSVDNLGLTPDDPRRKMVKLMNPLSEEQSVLRTSLLPGLLVSLRRNLSQRVADVALFEVGKVFIDRPGEKLPFEPTRLAGVLSGLALPASWWSGEKPVSLAHAKGAVEYLTQGLGISGLNFLPDGGCPPYLDAGAWCKIALNGDELGELGLISAACARAFDLDQPAYVFDLNFDLICEKAPKVSPYQPLPRYPEVVRDAALVLDDSVPAGELLEAARSPQNKKAQKWLRSVVIFDLYRGKPLDRGKKSLGLRFTYRDDKRTLTEKEVHPLHQTLVEALLKRFNAELRA